MSDSYHAPLRALEAFEKTTGLRVAIHDLSGRLRNFLPPERFLHSTPLCLAVKARHERSCVAFDAERTHRDLQELPEGRVQVCHAGLVEWVVPVFHGERLEWVLFAGQRRPGPELVQAVRDSGPRPARTPWPPQAALPLRVEDEEARTYLELLCQLAARLRAWREELDRAAVLPSSQIERHGEGEGGALTRRAAIQRFIAYRHAQPVRLADLAEHLHISESRAGHAVREACGKSFIELLAEARLRTAAGLLSHTGLPVLEVALRSGFGDLSNFHHAFHKRFRSTPLRYRRKNQASAELV